MRALCLLAEENREFSLVLLRVCFCFKLASRDSALLDVVLDHVLVELDLELDLLDWDCVQEFSLLPVFDWVAGWMLDWDDVLH